MKEEASLPLLQSMLHVKKTRATGWITDPNPHVLRDGFPASGTTGRWWDLQEVHVVGGSYVTGVGVGWAHTHERNTGTVPFLLPFASLL